MVAIGLFRAKTLLPVLVAVFLTPIPKRLGLYRWFFGLIESLLPPLVGLLPCMVASYGDWGFTVRDLYGDGPAGWDEKADAYRNRLQGHVAIVTGANSGTGYEISLALARLGANVTMACRNPSRCEIAAEKIRRDSMVRNRFRNRVGAGTIISISTMTVDVSSLASVRDFCDRYLARTRDANGVPLPLDMLFLNAGVGYLGPAKNGSLVLSADGIEITFATNVVGHHLMYRVLEPSLRRSDEARITPARIVQTSSSASYETKLPHKVATDLDTLNRMPATTSWFVKSAEFELMLNLYGQSKLAQILWVRELTAALDREAKGEGHAAAAAAAVATTRSLNPNSVLYANAAHPGMVATNIWGKNARNGLPLGRLLELAVERFQSFVWTPEEGALTLLYLGTAVEDLRTKNIRGQYYHPQSRKMTDHKFARDNDPETKDLQERLWEFLDELVVDYV